MTRQCVNVINIKKISNLNLYLDANHSVSGIKFIVWGICAITGISYGRGQNTIC